MSLHWVTHTFVTIWQPMLLGWILAGASSALAGFLLLDALWRYSIHDYKSRKRRERRDD